MSGEGIAAGVEALKNALVAAETDVRWNEKQLADVRKQWEKEQRYFEQAEQRLADSQERVYELRATLRELGAEPPGEPG